MTNRVIYEERIYLLETLLHASKDRPYEMYSLVVKTLADMQIDYMKLEYQVFLDSEYKNSKC